MIIMIDDIEEFTFDKLISIGATSSEVVIKYASKGSSYTVYVDREFLDYDDYDDTILLCSLALVACPEVFVEDLK